MMGVLELSSSFSYCSCSCSGRVSPTARAWQSGVGTAAAQDPRRRKQAALSHHERRRRLKHEVLPPRSQSRLDIFSVSPVKSKRRSGSPGLRGSLWFILLALLLFCECAAAGAHGDRQRLRLLARRQIVYDRSAPPDIPRRMPLVPRRESSDDDSSSSSAASSTAASSSTSTAASTTYDSSSTSTSTSLPQAFDTSLGNNFTSSSCPAFFDNFLDNSTFNDCVPLSLLIETSSSFFQATKSFLRITQVLDISCSVNYTECNNLMNELATELVKDSNCGADYRAENPTVMEAYNGFIAYAPSYEGGCIRDSSGSYCFANAITNSSAPSDSYPYYLPLGTSLPGGSQLTCNSCLQDTMAAYRTFSSNSTQPISDTYSTAASLVNVQCGPNFVNSSLAVASSGTSMRLAKPGTLSSVALLMTLFAFLS